MSDIFFHSGLWRSVTRDFSQWALAVRYKTRVFSLCIIPSYPSGNLKFRFIMLKKLLNGRWYACTFSAQFSTFSAQFSPLKRICVDKERGANIFVIVIYVYTEHPK